jgi:hypothetical protein
VTADPGGTSLRRVDDTNDEVRYRPKLPGLLGQIQTRERRWMWAAGICFAYAMAAEWRHSGQLAAAKVAAGAPRVLTPKCDGTVEDAPLVSADEYRLADGLVFERLNRTVKCMRGLEGEAGKVRECWRGITPMFQGDAAKRFGIDAAAILGKSATELQDRMSRERVQVERLPGEKVAGTGKYWIHWREFGRRGGKQIDESWSGVFTVQLLPVNDDSGGLVITDYTWEMDR